MADNKDIILGEISNAVTSLLGTSAAAVMRTAGASASKRLWPALPSGVSVEEAARIMQEGVKQLGGFGDLRITPRGPAEAEIEFKGCFFASMREGSGKQCGEQGICFFGFGLVEETFKRLTGQVVKVELTRRDDETDTCFEAIRPRAAGHG